MNFGACLVLAFIDHKIIWLLPAHADSPMRQPQVFTVSGTARTILQEVGWGTRDKKQPSPFHTNPCVCTDIQLNSDMQKPINKHLLFKHLGTKREVKLAVSNWVSGIPKMVTKMAFYMLAKSKQRLET